jgi:hypothetical protein
VKKQDNIRGEDGGPLKKNVCYGMIYQSNRSFCQTSYRLYQNTEISSGLETHSCAPDWAPQKRRDSSGYGRNLRTDLNPGIISDPLSERSYEAYFSETGKDIFQVDRG